MFNHAHYDQNLYDLIIKMTYFSHPGTYILRHSQWNMHLSCQNLSYIQLIEPPFTLSIGIKYSIFIVLNPKYLSSGREIFNSPHLTDCAIQNLWCFLKRSTKYSLLF